MGTSNSYWGPGNNTPLVPTWLGGGSAPAPAPGPDGAGGDGDGDDAGQGGSDGNSDGNNNGNNQDAGQPNQQMANGSANRFRGARSNFTRFIGSGGRDRKALGRSVSSYVSHSSGGANNAAKRIGSSKRVTAGIISFLGTTQANGIQAALTSHNLGNLIGKPIDEIFIGLMESICPDGGSVDEGIARNAFVETIAQVITEGMVSLDNLSADQFQHVIETFIANAIEGRLYNDIGTKVIVESVDIQKAEFIQAQVHDFIKGSVSDAVTWHSAAFTNLANLDANELVDAIYVDAYTILETLGENASNQ